MQQSIIILPLRKHPTHFKFFFRSDESNCRKMEGGAKLYDQGLLKECNLRYHDKTFTKHNFEFLFLRGNGFECGKFNCLPIESFCGTKPDFGSFHPERICPGFHFLNCNLLGYIN
jgi:hypothetical protein